MNTKKNQFTPGPWGLWADNRRETIFTVITPPDKYGSRIVGIQVRDPLAVRQMELENTASLISAAPDLLAALELSAQMLEAAGDALEGFGDENTRGSVRSAFIEARAAIAKAKGAK